MKNKIKLLLTASGLAVLLGAPSARASTTITNGTAGTGGAAITNDWVVPAGIYSVTVQMWGGGGGGGNVRFGTINKIGGAAGGGGGAYTITTVNVTPGQTNTFIVGGGGVGATSNNQPGTGGGDSSFPGATTAAGGAGGGGNTPGIGGPGGAVTGTGNYSGGPGGRADGATHSGPGGGSGSATVAGNATAGPTSTNDTTQTVGGSAGPGGGAGAAGQTIAATGIAGNYPGGGASAGFSINTTASRNGGNGGNGQIILTFPAFTGLSDIWVGNVNGTWDNAITTNWVDINLVPVVFTNGDVAVFKDSASNFTVNISGTVQPGGITVTNAVNNYTFSGGTIGGTGGLLKLAPGTLTLTNVGLAYTGSTVVNGGTLAIASAADNTLAGGISGSGNLTKSGAGTLTLAGANTFSGLATVTAGKLAIDNNATNNASYQVTGGTLAVNKATRGVTLTISNLTFGAGATGLSLNDWALSSLSPEIRVSNFTNAGTVTVSYTATNIAPGAIVLIDYDTATSVLGSFAAPSLPAGYTGMIVTNVANSSIDLVITGTPAKQWVGGDSNGPNGWDVADYANWSGGTQFTNGDYVSFLDGTSYTNIDVATVAPALMVVSNSTTTYAFNNGGGGITTPLLVKDGSGTMSLANPGNSITNINLRAGTLSFDLTATNASTITGGGTLQVANNATVTLSGNNSGFDGPIIVTNGGTLTLGANNVLGSTSNATTIASGAVLNVNAKQNQGEEIIVSGAGISGLGAIINNAGTQNNALSRVTLAGDTTFGGTGRWEIQGSGGSNAVLKANGAYNLTKTAANFFALVNVDVDPLLGDISVNQGTFQIAVTTSTNASLGNVNNTINLSDGTTLDLYNSNAGFVPAWNKQIVLGGGSVIIENTGTRSTAFVGPVNLSGNTLNLSGSAALTFSNALSGGGNVVKTGANAISLLGANNYTSTTVSNGSLTLSTASTVSGGCTVNDGATLGAQRTSSGGTLSMSGLTLTLGSTGAGAVTLQFDLAAYGVSANPVMDVSGGTLTTNAAIYNVTVLADLNGLTTGTFPLFKYASGAFTNAIATVTLPAGVVGTVTNNTVASRVELTVVSVARNLTWVGNVDSNWNINSPANWVQTGTTNATVYKEVGAGDNVVFDSSASNFTVNVAATVSPSSMQINGTNNYAIGGTFSIAGPAQLTVAVGASNTVTLTGNNTYTGGTSFGGGTTLVGSDAALGNATNQMLWSGGGALDYTGSATNTRSLSVGSGGGGTIIVDTNQTVELGGVQNFTGGTAAFLHKSGPGTLRLTGSGTQRLLVDQGTAILAGSASITNAGGANSSVSGTNGVATLIFKDNAFYANTDQLNIGDGTGLTNATRILGEMYVTNNAVLTLANLYVGQSLTATGRVYQSGGQVTTTNAAAGTWSLGGSTAADTNAFGGYYLSGGALNITNQNVTVGQWGSGELVVSGSGTLSAQLLSLGAQNSASSVGTVTVNGGTVTLSSNLRVAQVGNSGTVVITNGGKLTANALLLGVSATANTGSVTVGSGGTLTVGKVSGSATNQIITFNNGTLKANASSTTYMQGLTSATIGSGGLTVDTDTNAITINQNLTGGGGLTKAGAGTLTLTNQSYTGDTVVNAGTLAGIAGLSGTILQGNLIVTAGGTVSPGGSSLGVIYAANGKNLTLGGTNLFQIARSGFNLNEDQVQADGNITNGGTLTVTFDSTHITALTAGNTFPFYLLGGTLSGAFSSVNLPTVDPVNGNVLTWNTNSLATAGSISVASTTPPFTPPPPTNITYTVTSGQMVLGWPNGLGWLLQGQTNPLSVGLQSQTNWMNVATNSPYTNLFATPTVFYRLIYTNTP